ncbi:MAG: HAD family phosphatase [Firmicutes bacterium]|nr:HAD family phosphatase [Bacillota bacterium]
MRYRLLALDLDDTLLYDDFSIADEEKRAVEAVVAAGGTVALATGRMYSAARKVAEELGIAAPIISYGGASARMADGTPIFVRNVPRELALQILEYARRYQIHIHAYAGDQLVGEQDDEILREYARVNRVDYHLVDLEEAFSEEEPPKLLLIDQPERIDALQQALAANYGERLHLTKSKPYFLEVTHPEGTKGRALAALAAALGVNREEVFAIGDAPNDREMIAWAGLGVAVANATEAVRSIADRVVPSNKDHGVAYALMHLVLAHERV